MHPAAYDYVAKQVVELGPFLAVVEFGGRNVNGSVRDLFGEARYLTIDMEPGPGVDVVADAADVPLEGFDCVVCCEVLEHAPKASSLVAAARRSLRPGGFFIMTCAGDGRVPHSALDGGPLRAGEHYANVSRRELEDWLRGGLFRTWDVNVVHDDIRCVART